MLDLQSYLDKKGDHILDIEAPVSFEYDLTALQHALDARGAFPIVRARPVLADGAQSAFPLVCNLTADRALVAEAFGVEDHKTFAAAYVKTASQPIAPVDAPASVQDIVLEGEDCDLTRLPALRQHALDPGPYLTAAHATTYDPETGVDNTAIQRCWVKGPRLMSYYPYPNSHNNLNMRKFWAKGEPCPIAFWIGHHPKVLIGTQAKLAYPESHWAAAGGVLGEPLKVAPTLTHGEKVRVPADSEIVIEGFIPPDHLAPDGPFGEYTGYSGPQIMAPECEVVRITHRRNAVYHDYGSGLTDMLVPDNMAMEAKLYEMAKAVAPSVSAVYVPASGRRFHAYVQLSQPMAGEARDALAAILAYRRVKTAIAFDEDVDIFDDAKVMWALATRVQWGRDEFTLHGHTTSTLDPSLEVGAKTGSKLGVDATLPPADVKGQRTTAPVARPPADAMARAEALLAGAASQNKGRVQ